MISDWELGIRDWSLSAHRLPLTAYRLLPTLCCLLICGCSGHQYDVVPVSGRVTLDGKPMADVHVSFQPTAAASGPNPGPGSFGITDAEGRFRLQTIEPTKDGAVVGKHVVRLTTTHRQDDPEDDADAPIETVFPEQCGDGSIRFEVPAGGTDRADFDLTWQ